MGWRCLILTDSMRQMESRHWAEIADGCYCGDEKADGCHGHGRWWCCGFVVMGDGDEGGGEMRTLYLFLRRLVIEILLGVSVTSARSFVSSAPVRRHINHRHGILSHSPLPLRLRHRHRHLHLSSISYHSIYHIAYPHLYLLRASSASINHR